MTDWFAHHQFLRDFLSNCVAQIIGGLVSGIALVVMIEREHKDGRL